MVKEAAFIIDFQKRTFYSVGDNGLFLCGYIPEQVKNMGYQFFEKVVHPDDMFLWTQMHRAIIKSLSEEKFIADEIRFFICNFRFNSNLPFDNPPYYQMVDLILKPAWKCRQLKYGYCLLADSGNLTPGNLRVYLGKKNYFREYKRFRWEHEQKIKISKRERQIVVLEKQGLNRYEQAETLGITTNTVDNTKRHLIEKLTVQNFKQAIIYVKNHDLI